MSNALIGTKCAVEHKLVISCGVDIFEDFRGIFIQMSFIIRSVINLLARVHQLANVNTCGFCVLRKEIGELLQVVCQVGGVFDCSEERFFLLLNFFLLLFDSFLCNQVFTLFLKVLITALSYLTVAGVVIMMLPLHVAVVQQVICEEGDRVVGLVLVAFGNGAGEHQRDVGVL